MLVLVKRHPRYQLLDKLGLPKLGPALEQSEAHLPLLVVLLARGHGELARVLVPVFAEHGGVPAPFFQGAATTAGKVR